MPTYCKRLPSRESSRSEEDSNTSRRRWLPSCAVVGARQAARQCVSKGLADESRRACASVFVESYVAKARRAWGDKCMRNCKKRFPFFAGDDGFVLCSLYP